MYEKGIQGHCQGRRYLEGVGKIERMSDKTQKCREYLRTLNGSIFVKNEGQTIHHV